eukprot:CAMPEP_0172503774 /NCGR_PEP_ID=MMETSP1066-20121228/172206_1 /TAXON_ID=671091 /ORGANISM="Coscinodiscus wailesii, Strain CCMP2513" /LENGTH=178 /DNA_ID=CAMNT_0013279653 /DNA_START=11 /DNA_END=545 /DNA_ORIENTATION=+
MTNNKKNKNIPKIDTKNYPSSTTISPPKNNNDANDDNDSNDNNTRLCFKNLPPTIQTRQKLTTHILTLPRHHHPQQLQLTDIRIIKTRDGKSRNMAFVGFKTPEMARNVRKFFHRSFVGMHRLSVEVAFGKGSGGGGDDGGGEGTSGGGVRRPWSRHSVGSSRYEEREKRKRGRRDDD